MNIYTVNEYMYCVICIDVKLRTLELRTALLSPHHHFFQSKISKIVSNWPYYKRNLPKQEVKFHWNSFSFERNIFTHFDSDYVRITVFVTGSFWFPQEASDFLIKNELLHRENSVNKVCIWILNCHLEIQFKIEGFLVRSF